MHHTAPLQRRLLGFAEAVSSRSGVTTVAQRHIDDTMPTDWARMSYRPAKSGPTIREQRDAAKAMTQYFKDFSAAKTAEKRQ